MSRDDERRQVGARCQVDVVDRVGAPGELSSDLGSWLSDVLADVAPHASSLAVRLADDEEVRRANASYRGVDRATDVLSFPGGDGPEGHHLGDLLISWPTARRQAREARHSEEREVRELALHGLLHCLGHDHETDEGEMAALELELRDRWLPEAPS